MLLRSAGRRRQRQTCRTIAASFAQLHLPWLAPAQLRWTASKSSRHVLRPPSPRRQREGVLTHPSNLRRLATAAAQHASSPASQRSTDGLDTTLLNFAPDEHVPFDLPSPIDDRSGYRGLLFNDSIMPEMAPDQKEDITRITPSLRGSTRNLLAHLHTSLGVGRRDRAELIISRMSEQCDSQSPELLHAHHALLQDILKNLMRHGRDSPQCAPLLKDMGRWFEVEIRGKGTQPDVNILVTMLRACIRGLSGSRRERSIRRYVEIASQLGGDIVDDVLLSEEYDDNEFAILVRATVEYHKDYEDAEPGRITAQALAKMDSVQESGQAAPAQESDRTAEEQALEQAVEDTRNIGSRGDIINLEDIPAVRATAQKGYGLLGVKRAMEVFSEMPPLGPEATFEARQELAYARQRRLEDTSVEIAVERWRKAAEDLKRLGISTSMQSKPVSALMWQWYTSLVPALAKEIGATKKMMNAGLERVSHAPYLDLLPVHSLAANTILHVVTRMANGKNRVTQKFEPGVTLAILTQSLATTIEDECLADVASGSGKKGQKAINTAQLRKQAEQVLEKTLASGGPSKRKSKTIERLELLQTEWPDDVRVKLGALLLSKLIETAELPVTATHPRTNERVTQMQPAFLHRLKYANGKKFGTVEPNPALLEKLQSEPVGSLLAKRMPMLVEPLPWSGWDQGGYLHYPNPILRLTASDKAAKDYFIAADRESDLGPLYKGLTALGKVSWKVHHGVFKVQLEAWNSGEAIANFAPLEPEIPLPPEPEASEGPAVRRKWLTEMRNIANRKGGYHSKRCFQNFQLEIARTLLNETLYFPHNMDFRGRAYPIPPYLNHMGADNVRGLLVFAEGKELGENGLRWLKIHLATISGYDKASMEERVEYTMAHLEDIYDSVRNPLGGRRWWLRAEDAWQTLAACFELTAALDSPDPSKFVSHLPIQQDGTCNGLQHYAALGGDKVGAAQVNLEPSDRPADVYTAVADAVAAEVQKDAEAGNPVAQKLHGRINRKCVKQPVMTNVYGVTFYGARLQVRKQLEVLFPEVKSFDSINLRHMSHYITLKIFKSLGEMFAGAQAIQTWLGQCADRISTCLTPEQIEEMNSSNKISEVSGKIVTKTGKGGKARKTTSTTEEEEGAGAAQADTEEVKEIESGTKKTVTKTRKRRKARKTTSTTEEEEGAEAAQADTEEVKEIESGTRKVNRVVDEHSAWKTSLRSTVIWTTPLQLPVVQPYRSSNIKLVKTPMQTIAIKDPHGWDPVSRRKQLQAFPPNFIHSLDATHMLLSAMKCMENGMTFASIHDSFWTHAADVNRMSDVLRDAFVAMHSEDITGRLREEFEARYKGCIYMATVLADTPVGKRVQDFRAQFRIDAQKQNPKGAEPPSELSREYERMRLLTSEDAEERAKGEAMVTPGSIVSAEAESSFVPDTELAGQLLGGIPADPSKVVATVDPLSDLEEAALEEDAMDEVPGIEVAEVDLEPQAASRKPQKPRKKPPPKKLHVWLPLTFPEVPAKGDFDVRRLKQSRYFFH